MPLHEDAHLRILKIVTEEPDISQRQLAERLGVSLGKTNFLVRALLEKGLLKARNFRRSQNKLQYAYHLTPKGIAAKVGLTRSYLARKEAEYEALQAEIRALRLEVNTTHEPR
jgi:EPS-associated MarR family transcriptional regulator